MSDEKKHAFKNPAAGETVGRQNETKGVNDGYGNNGR